MTTFLLSLTMLAALAAGVVTPPYNHDKTPDQDRLRDGSCQTAVVVTMPSTNINV